MALWQDVDAVDLDGTLNADQKRLKKANMKASGLRDALLAFTALPHTYGFSKSGTTYSITISRLDVGKLVNGVFVIDSAGDCLGLWASGTKNSVAVTWGSTPWPCVDNNGVVVKPGPVFVWRSPRILTPTSGGTIDRGGGRLCTYDPVNLLKALLGDDFSVAVK